MNWKRYVRISLLVLLFVTGCFFMSLAWQPFDEWGTTEAKLIETNGNNLCTSCMGLYK